MSDIVWSYEFNIYFFLNSNQYDYLRGRNQGKSMSDVVLVLIRKQHNLDFIFIEYAEW